jgi:RNA polymerase-associated protein LEO1
MAEEQISSPPLSEAFPDEETTSGNGINGAADEEDDEEDAVQTGSRRQKTTNGTAAEPELDDLFGDEEDEEQPRYVREQTLRCTMANGGYSARQLDDEELDSGDDEGREDRVQQEDTQQYETHEVLSMDLEIARQPVPEPSDGEVCAALRMTSIVC